MKKVSRFFVISLLLAIYTVAPSCADENVPQVLSEPLPVETSLARPISDTNVIEQFSEEKAASSEQAEQSILSEPHVSSDADQIEAAVHSNSSPAETQPVVSDAETENDFESVVEMPVTESDQFSGEALGEISIENVSPVFEVQIQEAAAAIEGEGALEVSADVLPAGNITGELPGTAADEPANAEIVIVSAKPVVEPVKKAQPVSSSSPSKKKSSAKKASKDRKANVLKGVQGIGNPDGTVVVDIDQPKPMVKKTDSKGIELPQGIQRIVDKAGNWIDEFDDSTLEYVNKPLSKIGLEADSAELRPSGGGVGLEVSLKLHKDKDQKKKLSEEEQQLEKRKKVYSTVTPAKKQAE